MWKTAALGTALTATGAVKFTNHVGEMGRQATLQDYLAMRCGGGAPLPAPGAETNEIMALAAMHCWGCYAMAAGVAMLAYALWQAAQPRLKALRRRG
ncbi:MAG: hypothetical protein C0456_07755 [Hyphomonas sp.]|uniref:hypothetical protein n=1 Tax=Hyphomonas sp. TaxID=87 RepID=UPI001D99AA54|nr:hypothetical protein [Hyphomonas sp.]MBA4226513.1 hypothetical protein [Hyphomonas sp.]